ncbi:hypothetical protein FVEG_14838 [Fusarium verticillioides 7600]|uniref:Uncharacterized protein n=1 Tax=Gibberella moniliformis (strain M3125 / FGSC 7600) TaxID=334819 RepID=W7LRJ2_GIBM7|nr:hypothetical protein FVEG_14838 [Fusarium verticillioides 7600]EWG38095.1 hypothetical protein FVEG_14838 [Fusarium verticillioides 7600]
MTWWREGGLGDLVCDAPPLSHDAMRYHTLFRFIQALLLGTPRTTLTNDVTRSTTPSFLWGRLSGTSGNQAYAKPVSRSQAVSCPRLSPASGSESGHDGDLLGRWRSSSSMYEPKAG